MMKSGSVTALGAALALAVSTAPRAAVHRVPADFGTISAALAAAAAGDTVKVAAGTYFEHVVLTDGVELRGGYDGTYADPADPAANPTMIHGSGTGSAVTANGVGSGTIVDGFTLSGGGGVPGAGVIVNGGSPEFSDNLISGNRRAGIAGGVYIYGGSTAYFHDNTVKFNSSKGSGGGFHIQNSSPTLSFNVIDDNVAPNAGGAIYAYTSAATCDNLTMRNNRAGNGGGGAVRVQNTSGFTLSNSLMQDCIAAFGGGVFVKDNSTATLTDCDFVDCSADWSGASSDTTTHHGGGLAVAPFCTVTATDCTFDGCRAMGSTARGGAAYVRQGTLNLQGTGDPTDPSPSSYAIDCTSDYRGGAIWAQSSNGTIARVAFDNCSAPGLGGGLYLSECTYDIDQNLITGCSADDGGAIYVVSTQASSPPVSKIRNNTIFGCSAGSSTKAGAIGHSAPTRNPPIKLATIAGNIISNTLVGACITCVNGSKPSINCTTLYQDPSNTAPALPNSACTSAYNSDSSNRTGDPLFCGPGDFYLQDCSPEIGAVCNNALPGLPNRGASLGTCACPVISALEPATWGQIKALYR